MTASCRRYCRRCRRPRRCHRRRRWVEGGQRWRLPPLPTPMWVQEEGADGGTGPRAVIGAAINRRTSHKSRLLGARTSHQSRGAAPMISVANADVSARGRSRWWDRAPCRYSRGDQNQPKREWNGDPRHHFLQHIHGGKMELNIGVYKDQRGVHLLHAIFGSYCPWVKGFFFLPILKYQPHKMHLPLILKSIFNNSLKFFIF